MSSPYLHILEKLETQNFLRTLDVPQGLDFASNDTLKLSRHPTLIQRTQEYAALYGVGSGSSRLISGNSFLHEEIEAKIATFQQKPEALLFSSGFQANTTVLQALLEPQSYRYKPQVFADRLIHTSLIYGIKGAGLTPRRYRHNDLNHLEDLLKKATGPKYIVTESVFSMDGDRLHLADLIQLKHKYGAFLYIDEAHATGLYGPQGAGLALHKDVDLVMGTFSKAMGSFGAFVACDEKLKQYLINKCLGFIYTTALPPMQLGAIEAALELVPQMAKERKEVHQKSQYLRDALKVKGYDTGLSTTHIVPLIIGDAQKAILLSSRLKENHMHIPCIRPPTVPSNTSRLRISINLGHRTADVDHLVQNLQIPSK